MSLMGGGDKRQEIIHPGYPYSGIRPRNRRYLRHQIHQRKGQALLQGASLLQKLRTGLQWRLDGAFSGPVKKLRRQREMGNDEIDTDLEEMDEDSILDTDASWSQQSFDAGQKRSNHPVKTSEEKSWERLLRSIYYAMRNIIREANGESSQSGSPNPLPFNVVPEPRYWSSEFATTPIPDATDSRKPDLVLMDFRLKKNESGEKTWADVLTNIEITKSELVQGKDIPIFLGVATKGYLIMREQPWRHFVVLFSIANLQLRAHYMDRSGMIISQPLPINSNAMHFINVLNAITLSDLPSLGFNPTGT
jgi:Fungal protein kinase